MPANNNTLVVKRFLANIGQGRQIVRVRKKDNVYLQGDACDAIFYIKKGKIKLTVLSRDGKGATIAILNPKEFFGEGCLAAQRVRMGSATAITDCELMRIERLSMESALRREHGLSDVFVAYLLGRSIRFEADLVDQLLNSSEKRLARILLLLGGFGKQGKPEKIIRKINQETLAEMVGTTRSRVNFFMNRFRSLGFIHYNGELEIHSSLLNVILHDLPERSD
jgi:CRP/FNR family transcriptional regulator, cyclic AMP receptor protein